MTSKSKATTTSKKALTPKKKKAAVSKAKTKADARRKIPKVRMKDPSNGTIVRVPEGTELFNAAGEKFIQVRIVRGKTAAVRAHYHNNEVFKENVDDLTKPGLDVTARLLTLETMMYPRDADDNPTGCLSFEEAQWLIRRAAKSKRERR